MPGRRNSGRKANRSRGRARGSQQWVWLTSNIHATPGKTVAVKASTYDALKARSFRPISVTIQATTDQTPLGFQLVMYSHVGYPAKTHGPELVSPGSVRHFTWSWPPGEWWNAGTENTLYQAYSICLTNIKQQADAEGFYLIRLKVALSDYTFDPSCPVGLALIGPDDTDNDPSDDESSMCAVDADKL